MRKGGQAKQSKDSKAKHVIVRRRRVRIQKVALKLLKIQYLQVYLYLTSLGFCLWCQSSCDFKNLMNSEGLQTKLKITIGGIIFRKSCPTFIFWAGRRCFFYKICFKVGQNREHASERTCQAKPSLANTSRARLSEANQVKPRISWQNIAKQAS